MSAAPNGRRPNFFLVGAMKAGTTSMHRYLAQHPDIFMSPRKEPRYSGFVPDLDSGSDADGRWFTRSLDEYLSNFSDAGDQRVVGESSHVYLHSERAAQLIYDFAPDARILVLLRDPVQMIHARHQQSLWMTREDITDFAEALGAEEDRRHGRRLPPDAPYHAGLQYRAACVIAPQLERYLATFGRERVHVALLEDLARDPLTVYRGILEYLEVDPDFAPSNMERANQSQMYRSAGAQRLRQRLRPIGRALRRRLPGPVAEALTSPTRILNALNSRRVPRTKMSPELEAELTEFFRPDVLESSRILGRDLSAAWPRFGDAPQRAIPIRIPAGLD